MVWKRVKVQPTLKQLTQIKKKLSQRLYNRYVEQQVKEIFEEDSYKRSRESHPSYIYEGWLDNWVKIYEEHLNN